MMRSRSKLPPLIFVGIKYLLKYIHCSKGHWPQLTFSYRISIVVIPRNRILYLAYLTDLADLLIIKKSNKAKISCVQTGIQAIVRLLSPSNICSFNLNKSWVKKNGSEWSVPKPKSHSLNGFMCLIDCPDQSLVPKCELCMVSNDNYSTTFHYHLCKLIFSQKLTKMNSYLGYFKVGSWWSDNVSVWRHIARSFTPCRKFSTFCIFRGDQKITNILGFYNGGPWENIIWIINKLPKLFTLKIILHNSGEPT